MKNKIKNKNGYALETAIVFMMMISLLCMLMVTVSLVLFNQKRLTDRQTERTIDLYNIGDAFASDPENFVDGDYYGAYKCECNSNKSVDGDTYTLVVTLKSDNSLQLTVVVKGGEVISWTR